MATPIFVDTSAHYALADAKDPDHTASVSLLQHVPRLGYALVTSNYIISETYTLLRQRISWETACSYIRELQAGSTQIVRISADDEHRAWEILQQYQDQDFSYVDATSFAVMERLSIAIFFALTKTEREIYREAQRMLAKKASAVLFSASFFGPTGSLRKLWKNEAERKEVVASELYQWLSQRLAELRTQEAQAFDQEVETFSGRLTIVVPKSLHAALKREAVREGVSLSELIRLKLGVAYRTMAQSLTTG